MSPFLSAQMSDMLAACSCPPVLFFQALFKLTSLIWHNEQCRIQSNSQGEVGRRLTFHSAQECTLKLTRSLPLTPYLFRSVLWLCTVPPPSHMPWPSLPGPLLWQSNPLFVYPFPLFNIIFKYVYGQYTENESSCLPSANKRSSCYLDPHFLGKERL